MENSSLLYLFTIAFIALGIMKLEQKQWKIFRYLPGIVIVYALSMFVAQNMHWSGDDTITQSYKLLKNNLLPAMLFLMLLSINFRAFVTMGRSLLIAYSGAFISLIFSFIFIFWLFNFTLEEHGIFAALSGSWMGGTANMLAIGAALHVSESQMGYAMIVDSVNYTFWVMGLLSLVVIAPHFNRWSGANISHDTINDIGCSCTIGPKRYWLLLIVALFISLLCQILAMQIEGLSQTTWVVLIATLFGLLGSQTSLAKLNGSNQIANTMLYLLVALIGSRASFENGSEIVIYIFAGSAILLLHALCMIVLAKVFKLDLFSIGVASLANIGGVASAPLLAAAYNRSLIGIAVLMAIMGYLFGTFGGLFVGYILQVIAS
ncbi:MAG: DUF819 family protein [Campylobacterota bacterium]|nr:DUF819 family protein [Campylobacterota bacterium]